mmetsp:Transcript_2893/g.10308  ORF Transcript_2893/g.10308 Transcript_2893/m.10308 type:complete len:325 (-) Transcript_2893:811-1785(-)
MFARDRRSRTRSPSPRHHSRADSDASERRADSFRLRSSFLAFFFARCFSDAFQSSMRTGATALFAFAAGAWCARRDAARARSSARSASSRRSLARDDRSTSPRPSRCDCIICDCRERRTSATMFLAIRSARSLAVRMRRPKMSTAPLRGFCLDPGARPAALRSRRRRASLRLRVFGDGGLAGATSVVDAAAAGASAVVRSLGRAVVVRAAVSVGAPASEDMADRCDMTAADVGTREGTCASPPESAEPVGVTIGACVAGEAATAAAGGEAGAKSPARDEGGATDIATEAGAPVAEAAATALTTLMSPAEVALGGRTADDGDSLS